ncbi:MAG: hypothetical protein HZA17_11280 [Nitrospirae bacterium]|nr:hypothetical protein [Nitrospirota bacterium]
MRIFIVSSVYILLILAGNSSAITVDNHVITDDPKSNTGCSTPTSKTLFSPADARAYFWVHVLDASIGSAREWRWYSPDNALYSTAEGTFSYSGTVCTWTWIDISGQAAASKLGRWRAELSVNDSLAVTHYFYIGNPQPPVITFTPPNGTSLLDTQIFDFSFSVDFGAYPELSGFSFRLQNIDVTDAFFSLFASGYIRASIQGNTVTVTIPGVTLPVGQYNIGIVVSSPGGTATGNWSATVSPGVQVPKYSLSGDQQKLISLYGNPEYLTISLNSDSGRREETWSYAKTNGKMYVFWDGERVKEESVSVPSNIYTNPPRIDPSLFAMDTQQAHIIQLFGSSYTMDDQSSGSLLFKTMYYQSLGLAVSFSGNSIVAVQTLDKP